MNYTISDLLERYVLEILPQKNTTRIHEKRHIEFWREEAGHFLIKDVNSLQLEEIANKLYKKKLMFREGFIKSETRRKYIMTLSYIFNVAIMKWKWINHNPANGIERHNPKKNKVKVETAETHKKEFIDFIQSILDERKMTHAALANLMGISKSTVGYLLDPSTNTTFESVARCLKALKVNYNFKFRFKDEA